MELKESLVNAILENGRFFDTINHNWSHQGHVTSSSGAGIGVQCLIGGRYYGSGVISHRHPYWNCWNEDKNKDVRNRKYAEMIADNLLDSIEMVTNLGFIISKKENE